MNEEVKKLYLVSMKTRLYRDDKDRLKFEVVLWSDLKEYLGEWTSKTTIETTVAANDWKEAIEKVKAKFPNYDIVIGAEK